jgi:chromosome segregation ATPase
MGTSATLPQKQDVPGDLRRIVTTLTDEAQNAAVRKCQELGFDPNKGRISLEETLINLSQARDILLDAIDNGKLTQLPLKLQYALLSHSEKAAQALTALVNGTDAVINLEDAVEELTASIWQFNLHNLSDQVLGFHNKMNQLKSLETRIRQVSREAGEFASTHERARALLEQISEVSVAATTQRTSLQSSVEAVDGIVKKTTEQDQKLSAIAVQIEQYETATAKQLANSKQAAADTEAIASKSKELQTEIDAARASLKELTSQTQVLLTSTENAITSHLSTFNEKYAQFSTEIQTGMSDLSKKTEASIAASTADSKAKFESAEVALQHSGATMESRISELVKESSGRLSELEKSQEARFAGQLNESGAKIQEITTQFTKDFAAVTQDFSDRSEAKIQASDAEAKRLVSQLDELEGRIKDSIDKATGYTLFHSFQKRQLDIADSKRFWGYMLGALVLVSLCASGVFIWSLQYVHEYNAAFFLKLSISIPLIYGIAFCNVQYARERRLEEEYAFKSNISISLDPYQKLVAGSVDKTKPEELAKYTAFLIDSVNRVFTSPTERIFEDHSADKTSAEKLIKALGGFIDPLVKALKK